MSGMADGFRRNIRLFTITGSRPHPPYGEQGEVSLMLKIIIGGIIFLVIVLYFSEKKKSERRLWR